MVDTIPQILILALSVMFLRYIQYVTTAPQIFTDSYASCEFKLGSKKIVFPDKLWSYNNTDIILYFSFCKTLQNNCGNRTSSCLILRQNNQIIDLGNEFVPSDDGSTLVTSNGAQCPSDPAKNYKLSVNLQCSDAVKLNPRLMAPEDDCTFDVFIMRPDCIPKCTEIIADTYLLDFRSFKQNIQVEVDEKKFSLNLCGFNKECSGDTAACEISGTGVVPLATSESQYFYYDVSKNELTARGRFRDGRIARDIQVLIKCNWDTDLANATYKKVKTQGKRYRFELESSFGCIKLPHRCIGSSMDNLHYDLGKLYREKGWNVEGVPEGNVVLNICGPLKDVGGVCADQYSQVCHSNSYNVTNRGSILLPLKADEDVVKAKFVSGSTCAKNPQVKYSTEILFKCSKIEKGPIFKEFRECIMLLEWETPQACPIDLYKSEECNMNDRISNRNLQGLYSKTDIVYPLDANNSTYLVYNLCGPISQTCGDFNNASFCVKGPNNEAVVGFDTRELISENGQIRLELQGGSCLNKQSRGEVTAHFVCTYENPAPPSEISVIEDDCKYNITIFTNLACLTHNTFKDCTYSTANFTYDLSPLIQKTKNYVVSHEDIDYVFNLCGPIINGPEALCRANTMVCWNNKTEVNVGHKYKSLGGVAGPRMRNNTLIVEAGMGSLCEGGEDHKTVFKFECSQTKFAPVFTSKDKCIYNFVWKTPEACPQENKCVINGTKPDATLDITKLQNKTIKVNVDKAMQYEFHLCSDMYIKTFKGIKDSSFLNLSYVYDGNPIIVLDLRKNCDDNNRLYKVFLKLECAYEVNDSFQETSFENCVLNMTVHTHLACASTKEQVAYAVSQVEKSNGPQVLPQNAYSVRQPTQKSDTSCSVTNPRTKYEFNLSRIKSEEISFNYSKFAINLDGNLTKCGSIFCKNDTAVVINKCPVPSFDYSQQIVTLQYSLQDQCSSDTFSDPYDLSILLKCAKEKSGGKILKDDKCKSVIAYDSPETCLLLKEVIISAGNTQTAVIAGIVSSIVIFTVLAVTIYLYRRRCREYIQLLPLGRDKSSVPIYVRNVSL